MASEPLELQWVKTSSRTYERSLDDMEKFYALAGKGGVGATDGQHWHIAIIAKIKTTDVDLERDIPIAWKMLRQINPCLSAVAQGDRLIYTIADEEELQPWINETLHFHQTPSTSREMFPIRNYTGRASLHVLLQTRELCLLAPHTHLDGIGAYTAMNNLVQALVNVSSATNGPALDGNEAKNLSPPLDILADIPAASDSNKILFQTMLGRWMAGFAGVNPQPKDTKQPCGDPKIISAPFNVSDSHHIVTRCKELGVTVTAAMQAALSLALRKQINSMSTVQSAVNMHNVREWVDKTKYPAVELVGPLSIPVPTVFTLTDEFTSTAQLASQKYREPEETGLLRKLPSFWGNDMIAIVASPPPGTEPPNALGLVSLGIVDTYLRPLYQGAGESKVEVEDAWLGITLYSADILLYVWTLRGAMRLQFVYNEAYHESNAVVALLHATRNELLQGLQ
ncbi:hypothetical protein G7046_g1845 [Stylonectria norvegica]|nr:hypothetical protein G7046_g1845 [Stylonectria norvegica]